MLHKILGFIFRASVPGLLLAVTVHADLQPNAIHPAYEIREVRLPSKYNTIGLAFLSDGRMVILTAGVIGGGEIPPPNSGSAVYLASGVDGASPSIVKIASMFKQPSGLTVVNDTVYVADRDAFYALTSLDNVADPANNVTKIANWVMGAFWHQWVFTPMYKDGFFYAPYSGTIVQGGPSDVIASSDYSGAFLKWDRRATSFEKVAGGLRSPNGANMDESGEMFVMDNQGSWLPGCAFLHIKPGRFYGHRQSPPQAPNWGESLPYQPPAVWIPYPTHTTPSIVGVSSSQPIYVKVGPYAGQWLVGDASAPGINRLALDTVAGEYQGAVFRFSNGTSNSAVNRMAWGPEGALYMGTLQQYGNWPGNGTMPLYRMTPKAGGSAFEMKSIHSLADGFEIVFTQPVDPSTIVPSAFSVKQWHYARRPNYGCCKDLDEARSVANVEVSDDRLRVHLKIGALKAMDYVVAFKLTGILSAAGTTLWDNEAWYTLNAISNRTWDSRPVSLATSLPTSAFGWGAVSLVAVGPGRLQLNRMPDRPWSLDLMALDGSLQTRLAGQGRGPWIISSGHATPRTYLLRLRAGSACQVRNIFF